LKWTEGRSYAQSFWFNEISGNCIFSITPEMLEGDLGVKNPEHRRVILESIRLLFPERKLVHASHAWRMGTLNSVEKTGRSPMNYISTTCISFPMAAVTRSAFN